MDSSATYSTNVDFFLSSPHLNFPFRANRNRCLEFLWLRPTNSLDEPPIVLQQQVAERNLHLVGSEKPSWACMLPMSKKDMLRCRCHELPVVFLSRLLSHLEEPASVELLGIGIDLWIHKVAENYDP